MSNYPTTQQSAMQHTEMQHTEMQQNAMHQSAMQQSAMQQNAMQQSAMQQNAMQQSAMQQSAMQQNAMQQSAMQQSILSQRSQSGEKLTRQNSYVVTGQHRVVSVTQRVDESRQRVIGERTVERQVRCPRRVVREEIIEKTIIVPEKRRVEEIVEDTQIVKEKVIEVSKPMIVEKIIEVPEIEYVEKIVEVPQVVYEKRVIEKPVVVHQERVVEKQVKVPRYVEKLVEDVQYREVPVTKEVEVEDVNIVYEHRDVEEPPTYIDKMVPTIVNKNVTKVVERKLPIPVEAQVRYNYEVPEYNATYSVVNYPVYLPRFIEVPVAVERLTPALVHQSIQYMERVRQIAGEALPPHIGQPEPANTSLCEIENVATAIINTEMNTSLSDEDIHRSIARAWNQGSIQLTLPVQI